MKTLSIICLLATAAFAAGPPKPAPVAPTPAAKTIRMDERTIPTINTKLRYDTWIVFPKGEIIQLAGGGDLENWEMLGANPKKATNIFTIKPSVADAASNLHIQTNRGSYSFWLKEISRSCAGCAPDVKIFVEPVGQDAETPETIAYRASVEAAAVDDHKTIADLRGKVAGLETDVLQAKREARTAKLDAENEAARRVAVFARTWPALLRCDFEFSRNKEPFNVGAICTDGKFTYVESGSRGVESVYAVKPGSAALVQFSYERGPSNHEGVYILNGIITRGYLQTAKRKRLKFAIKG